MPQKINSIKNKLTSWTFSKPAIFALLTFGISTALILLYSFISAALDISATWPLAIFMFGALIWNMYYLIKKLPHDNIQRNDFIAITNACSIITIVIPLVTLLIAGRDAKTLHDNMIWLLTFHNSLFWVIGISSILLYLYLLGVAISNLYAKYKRSVSIGISKWKVICSMPFGFLLMWTPGYLIEDKKSKSDLVIKSETYNKFNKWVVSKFNNTLFMFLLLILLRNIFAGTASLILTLALLIIYALWSTKHKSDMIKNINQGYSLFAVYFNIATIIVLLTLSFIKI